MLLRGSKGVDVQELQSTLNSLGYDCGPVDGDFGLKTAAAVIQFQKEHGLTADGVVGLKTQKALSLLTLRKATDEKLSDHFREKEFACRCCGMVKLDYRLLNKLEALKEKIKQPVYITCGYRCPKHNEEVWGVANSFHMKGMAADVVIPRHSPFEVAKLGNELGFGGIGVYTHGDNCFTHLDVGPVRRWGD